MQVKVIIPTKGRPTAIITHKYVSNCILCVEQRELGIYKEHNPDLEFVPHPDSVVGLGPKREWIYDKFGDCFMMDDDVKGFLRMTQKQGESSKVSPDLAYDIIQNCANMAKMCGCYLYSFNSLKRPEHYPGHQAYKLSGCMNESAFGLLKGADKLRIDPNIKAGYEFYISGLNAYHYRMAFFDLRFTINQDGFGDDIGGASTYRTLETEKRDLELLKYYFGEAIEPKSETKNKGKHEFSKRLRIPF